MQIRSENDLKLAYETINSFKEMMPMAQKPDAALEYIKELKRDIRGFFRKEKEKLQRRLVKDNGIDGYIVLMQLPSFLNSKEDAAVYFEENEVMTCRPSISHQIQRRRRISDGSRMERHGRNQPEQQSGSRRQTEGAVQNQRHQREEDVQQRHEFLFKAGY